LDPGEDGWLRVALSGGFYALLVPVVEEILYRGIVLPLAAVRVGGWGAVLVATFAWAMAHGQAPLLPLIALGIALGWLTLATGSLWASIAFHVAWNGSVVGYEITRAVWGAGAGGPVPGWLIFVAVAAFVLGWARVLDVAREGGIRAVWAPPEGSR
jgi:membrane protease YdiL (CAAX protease family)